MRAGKVSFIDDDKHKGIQMNKTITCFLLLCLVLCVACSKNIKQSQNYTEKEKLEREIIHLEPTLKEDPGNYLTWVKVGNNYYDIGEPRKAIIAYENALSINGNDPNVWSDLGSMYRRIGKIDKSVESFIKALSINPDHPQCNVNLGIVYDQDYKDYEKAEKYFLKYLSLPNRINEEFDKKIKERLMYIKKIQ